MEEFKKFASLAFHFFRVMRNDKILFVIGMFGAFIILASKTLSGLSYTDSRRFILDFGLAGMSLSLSFSAIIGGAILIPREIERKTIYMILCRPIKRPTFLAGSYAGASLLLLTEAVLMLLILAFFTSINGIHEFSAIAKVTALEFFKAEAMLAVSILFSVVTTSSIALMSAFSIYIIGFGTKTIMYYLSQSGAGFIGKTIFYIFPNLEILEAKHMATHSVFIPSNMLLYGFAYTTLYSAIILLIGIRFFNRKEIQ